MSENGNGNNGKSPREPWANGGEHWSYEWKEFVKGHRPPADGPKPLPSGNKTPKSKTGYDWTSAKKEGNLDNETLFGLFASDTATEIVNLLIAKQADYGPNSIQSAPYGAVQGLITRLHDKLSRAANLTVNGRTSNNESLRDTFLDIAGYGIIGLMVLDGKFPKANK
jgi:hypothetical protein